MNNKSDYRLWLLARLPRPVVVTIILLVEFIAIALAVFDLGGMMFIFTTLIVAMGLYDIFMLTAWSIVPLFLLYHAIAYINKSLPKREKKDDDHE